MMAPLAQSEPLYAIWHHSVTELRASGVDVRTVAGPPLVSTICHEEGDPDVTEAHYKIGKDAQARVLARKPDVRLCESDFE